MHAAKKGLDERELVRGRRRIIRTARFRYYLGVTARYALMTLVLLFTATPFIWMFGSAFRPVQEIFKYISPISWHTFIPAQFTIASFKDLLFKPGSMWGRFIFNSLFVASTMVVGSVIVNSLAAYGFARLRFPGREVLFVLILLTVIIPFEAISLPLYLVIKQFGWIDTYQAIIVPGIANAFTIFLLRQFFMGIPKELEEAAIIDGAGYLRIYWQIIMPLSRPALTTVGVMAFQAGWDAFIWPLIATNSAEVRLIQVAVSTLAGQDATYWNELFAAMALCAAVPIVLFLLLQRYYKQSIMTSGLKQ